MKAKAHGLSGLDIEQIAKPGRNGKRPNHYAGRVKLARIIDPRLTRRGLSIRKWPLDHLAIVAALSSVYPNDSWSTRLHTLNKYRPDISQAYESRNKGRTLTANILRNRDDKGIRQREQKNYKHLIPNAIKEVEKW